MREADGWVTIGTNLDTDRIDKQIELLYGKLERLNQEYEALESEPVYEGQAEDLMKINNEIDSTTRKIRNLVKEKDKLDNPPNNLLNFMNKFERQAGRTARRVVNIGLAFIGIRSVYGFLSSSMSLLSNYNEQLAKDIQYIKYALATTLEPVITRLVQLVYRLLTYLGYIMKAWFGINIFARAGADAMNKTLKSAKELKKVTASFDEMEILQDTSGGADSGAVLPSVDLSQQNIDPPGWLVWLGDHGAEIISIITGIATALALLRLGLSPLMASGIGIAVAGLVYAIISLLDYLKDPTWENFGKVVIGIGVAVAGIALAFGAWPVVVAGVIIAVIGVLIKYRDKIKEVLDNVVSWLKDRSQSIREKWGDDIANVYDTIVNTIGDVLEDVNNFINGVRQVFDGLLNFIKGIFTGDWKLAWQGLGQIVTGVFEMVVSKISMMLTLIKGVVIFLAQNVGYILRDFFKMVVNQIINRIESILNAPTKAINGIIKAGRKLGIKADYISEVRLPRLAKGGIINMPGRGVNYGGANIGERGAEGVIPLTDSQQMDLLGQSIARHMVINLTNINQMNGRVLSRELKKVQNENDFAYNR